MSEHHNHITFILDGKLNQVSLEKETPYSTNTTLLQYLRSLDNHKGTKEGCAEGDCGACTVVLATTGKNGKLRYRAVNSCLVLLPQVQGTQVITVENIADNSELHPVQQAMVDYDASQCGFCTPGFVMSLFALYKSQDMVNRVQIEDALAGNLCRCTGYQPIIEAGLSAFDNKAPDTFDKEEQTIKNLLSKIDKKDRVFESGPNNYFQPVTLSSALKLKSSFPDALVVNGATDIALRITKKKETLPLIIDLSKCEELNTIRITKDSVEFGAGVSLEDVKAMSELEFPALYKMLALFGSKQIRHLGTLAGNVASASPIGDTLPILMAYNAIVICQSDNSTQNIPINEFITGYRTTRLKKDELITRIEIPLSKNNTIVDSLKSSKRKDLDISTVCCALRLQLDKNKKIQDINLYFGGMAATTKAAENTEAWLKGKIWDEKTIGEATAHLEKDFKPISDARAEAEGRMQIAKNILIKLWTLHE